MSDKYILEGRKVVPADLMTWARWYEAAKDERIVAKTKLSHVEVSTVFLGLDHRPLAIDPHGPPQIFETMIFGGPQDGWTDRCATWDEAEEMHKRGVAVAEAAFSDTSEAVKDG